MFSLLHKWAVFSILSHILYVKLQLEFSSMYFYLKSPGHIMYMNALVFHQMFPQPQTGYLSLD